MNANEREWEWKNQASLVSIRVYSRLFAVKPRGPRMNANEHEWEQKIRFILRLSAVEDKNR